MSFVCSRNSKKASVAGMECETWIVEDEIREIGRDRIILGLLGNKIGHLDFILSVVDIFQIVLNGE